MEKMHLYTELDAHLSAAFQELSEAVESEYEVHGGILNSVSHEAYDGFIPFTNGGIDYTAFMDLSYLDSTGKRVGNEAIQKQMETVIDRSYIDAREQFISENKIALEGIPEDKINYNDLYELKQGDLAEALSEMERSWLEEGGTFFLQYRVLYFSADNHRNETGKDELCFMSGVNLDYEYGRDKGLELCYENTITMDDLTPEKIDTILAEMQAVI